MTHSADQVKCPLCEGHAALAKQEVLSRLQSQEFKDIIAGYAPPQNRHPVEEVVEEPDYVGPTGPTEHLAVAQKQNSARERLMVGGRRSPKE
jgi:hypothetical protein